MSQPNTLSAVSNALFRKWPKRWEGINCGNSAVGITHLGGSKVTGPAFLNPFFLLGV
jgi:hypothetical protein